MLKGLNCIQKRWLALKDFRISGSDVAMVQETHFHAGGLIKFVSKYFPTSYLAFGPYKPPPLRPVTGILTITFLIPQPSLVRDQ